MKRIYKLQGVVQHYNWGGTEFIPALIGLENKEAKPVAEYWLGAHPSAPAIVEGEGSLQEFIGRHRREVLGEQTTSVFASLPFLFKVLDVRQMLSIQVHPSKAAAAEAYRQENEQGIPLTAPHRNYKDENHKPELMAALGDFWLLHGFKPVAELNAVLQRVPELSALSSIFGEGDYKALYEAVMTMPQEKVDETLSPLVQRLLPKYEAGELDKSTEDFWAARAVQTFCKNDHYDRGIFSIYFFNLLNLKKGEAIYQAAGLPHAYLEGQNMEVMAASDNVLRAGLTDKHVAVAELMKHVRFEATVPNVIRANDQLEQHFHSPAAEFLLRRQLVTSEVIMKESKPTIYLVYDGEGTFVADGEVLALKRGEALFCIAETGLTIHPKTSLEVYSVTVP